MLPFCLVAAITTTAPLLTETQSTVAVPSFQNQACLFQGNNALSYSETYFLNTISSISKANKLSVLYPSSDSMNREINKAYLKLSGFYQLEDGWDGYGGTKPSISVLNAALEVLKEIENSNFKAPKLMLTGAGEVGFYWDLEEIHIELSIDESDTYSFFVANNGELISNGDITGRVNIPYDVMIHISNTI